MATENSNGSTDLTLLGRYRIVSEISAGEMGDVYLAEDTKLNRRVVTRSPDEQFSQNAGKLKPFIHKVKAASAPVV